MKVMKKVGLAMALVGLMFTSAQAGPYVGFQIGPNFPATSNTRINGFGLPNPSFDPGITLGVQGGFDFNDSRYQFPHWARYFGVAIDYQYNTLNSNNFSLTGHQNALSFLGVAKYPLMVTKEYPLGRLFPYVAAGPSVIWTNLGGSNATSAGVVVEPGIKYMFTPRISGDVGYRFRYAAPQFERNVRSNNYNHSVMARINYHF